MREIAIAGAGLVGSMLSVFLAKRGYKVTLFERRADFRKSGAYGGRSINLALSSRGLRALALLGLDGKLREKAIPMFGRRIHPITGEEGYMPYGKEGQCIYSVSRSALNQVVLDAAEEAGVEVFFNAKIQQVDLKETQMQVSVEGGPMRVIKADYLVGSDGAYSAIRSAFLQSDRFNFSQEYIEHGYKELSIPATAAGQFQLKPDSLHIWPRESFMMIALPNPDGTFTCTLFFPFEGAPSFGSLKNDQEVYSFFEKTFPDALALMPNMLDEFRENPSSSLVTVRCFPWVKNRTVLIGDAAHAIVPFYGQGMNAGFEDCRVFNELLDLFNDDWERVLPEFQKLRKPNADSVARLALDNFIEMRDLVSDPQFQLQKKIEARIHELYPHLWTPLYSMVTFSDGVSYSDAYHTGQRQKEIMSKVLSQPEIARNWEKLDFLSIAQQLNSTH